MSIAGLMDHRAEVWRPTEKRGFAAEVVQTLEPIELPKSGRNCAVVPAPVGTMDVQDLGPGEAPRGRTQLYMAKALDVQERDVIRLVDGPEAPSRWRAVAVAKPRGHHYEVVVEPWVGTFPEAF